MNLQDFKLAAFPETVFYIPNFISVEQENLLIGNILKINRIKWQQLLNRRLINFGGIPHIKGMIAEHIPDFLQAYVDQINSLGIFDDKKANHILLNEYLSGQGIFKHLDGPLFYPTISTLSLGSHTVLEFFKAGNEEENASSSPDFKIYVEPRSLLILKNSMYDTYLHSISEITEDDLNDQLILNIDKSHKNMLPRVTRYSLTIRHVPKTSKMKIKFGK